MIEITHNLFSLTEFKLEKIDSMKDLRHSGDDIELYNADSDSIDTAYGSMSSLNEFDYINPFSPTNLKKFGSSDWTQNIIDYINQVSPASSVSSENGFPWNGFLEHNTKKFTCRNCDPKPHGLSQSQSLVNLKIVDSDSDYGTLTRSNVSVCDVRYPVSCIKCDKCKKPRRTGSVTFDDHLEIEPDVNTLNLSPKNLSKSLENLGCLQLSNNNKLKEFSPFSNGNKQHERGSSRTLSLPTTDCLSDIGINVKHNYLNSFKKKQQRQKALEKSDYGNVSIYDDVPDVDTDDQDSIAGSTTDLSITSSCSTIWSRENFQPGESIRSSELREKLKSSPKTKVTSKDQRILELMYAKREGEVKLKAQQEAARRAWEHEKQRDLSARLSSDRRRSFGSFSKIRKADDQRNSWKELEDWDQISTFSEKEVDDRLLLLSAEKKRVRDERRNDKNLSPSMPKGLLEKERNLMERKQQLSERKKNQETKLEKQSKELEKLQNEVVEKQKDDIEKASAIKEKKEQEEALVRKVRLLSSKKRQEERKKEIEQREKEEQDRLRESIIAKQRAAEARSAGSGHVSRSQSKNRGGSEVDKKIERTRKNQKKLEEEMQSWHSDLEQYRRLMEIKAEEERKAKIEEKRKRLSLDRKSKEKHQKTNMKKMLEAEEEWKADVEATIAMKDARTQIIKRDKEEAMSELKTLAQASSRLRDELKVIYSTDKIDQLSKRAEQEARFGTGVYSATKNLSTISLN